MPQGASGCPGRWHDDPAAAGRHHPLLRYSVRPNRGHCRGQVAPPIDEAATSVYTALVRANSGCQQAQPGSSGRSRYGARGCLPDTRPLRYPSWRLPTLRPGSRARQRGCHQRQHPAQLRLTSPGGTPGRGQGRGRHHRRRARGPAGPACTGPCHTQPPTLASQPGGAATAKAMARRRPRPGPASRRRRGHRGDEAAEQEHPPGLARRH